MGDSQAQFQPSRVFILSELPAREKEKMFELLLENETKFFQDEAGNYIGSLRLLAPGVKKADKAHSSEATLKRSLLLPYEERMTNLSENGFVSVQIAGKEQFDYSPYPRFVTLISDTGDVVRPKARILSWMMKIIEDIYDARFAQEKADAEEEEDEKKKKSDKVEKKKAKKEESIHMKVFPIFVVRRLSLTMGLKKVVDQTCWDLLYNLDRLRKDYLEVEVFARFLQEFYDYQDLLFYLYVRSVVSSVLHISFKTKWTRPEQSGKKQVSSLWMSYRECMQVSKIVFGEDGEPMMREFINLLVPHMVGQRTETSDTRRIDITQFLHLAVVGYHQSQTQDAAAAAASSTAGADAGASAGSAGAPNVTFQTKGGGPARISAGAHRLGITDGSPVVGMPAGVAQQHALSIHMGQDLSGSSPGSGGGTASPSKASPTLQSIAAQDDARVHEEMVALQQDRQREFLDNMCQPLEDYMHSGALTESDTENILHALFDSLNGVVDRRVERSGVVVEDLDHFDELLLNILRDKSLWEQMEKERDRLVMSASASSSTTASGPAN